MFQRFAYRLLLIILCPILPLFWWIDAALAYNKREPLSGLYPLAWEAFKKGGRV